MILHTSNYQFELINSIDIIKLIKSAMFDKLQSESTINNDLKMINTFLENSLQPKLQPRNLSELSDIIKNRLSKNICNKEEKYNCRQWLKSKGMNVQPLIQFIQSKKKQLEQTKQKDFKWDTSRKVSIQPILFNHEQYSKNAFEYASISLLQFVSTNRTVRKRHFKNLMVRLGCQSKDFSDQYLGRMDVVQTARNGQKRQKYIKTVKKLLQFQLVWKKEQYQKEQTPVNPENDLVARLFFEVDTHQLWHIFYNQVKNVNFSKPKAKYMTELLINSLRLIQTEFNDDLPANKEAINHYLQQNYLKNCQRIKDDYLQLIITLLAFFNLRRFVRQIKLYRPSSIFAQILTPLKEVFQSFMNKNQGFLLLMYKKPILPFGSIVYCDFHLNELLFSFKMTNQEQNNFLPPILIRRLLLQSRIQIACFIILYFAFTQFMKFKQSLITLRSRTMSQPNRPVIYTGQVRSYSGENQNIRNLNNVFRIRGPHSSNSDPLKFLKKKQNNIQKTTSVSSEELKLKQQIEKLMTQEEELKAQRKEQKKKYENYRERSQEALYRGNERQLNYYCKSKQQSLSLIQDIRKKTEEISADRRQLQKQLQKLHAQKI